SYFEAGTLLTINHGHAAMMGVFGMLGIGLVVFVIRQTVDGSLWRVLERYVRVAFWGLNGGLLMMVVMSLFPAGVLQFVDVLENGYWSGAACLVTWYSSSSVSCPSRLPRCAFISMAGKRSGPPAFRLSDRERLIASFAAPA